jgi:UrcA family protein
MNTPIRTSMFAAGLFGFICAAGSVEALAAEPTQALTKIVHYGDLNLDSEQGAKVLYARLRSAARQVCSPLQSIDLSLQRQWEVCFNNAIANAVGEVNKTTVSALHAQMVYRPKG